MVQMKKSSVVLYIPGEPYMIWLSFMVCLFKTIISPGAFFTFSKFWFCGLLVGYKTEAFVKIFKG